ncbi:hypothetical protein HAX54_036963 [Datura stramonium]|uniref:Uncharacterized protein n=1 Tax=Datura stramonium TaxID=4076 RepID=A0ABS8SGK4_DATST|nr:hypothetical protein [Datura stramonium]
MAKSDAKDNEEVNFLDSQKNLKTLSQKELRALANVLIDSYYSVISEKDNLATELNQSKGFRKSLIDDNIRLNGELSELAKENLSLDEKIMKDTLAVELNQSKGFRKSLIDDNIRLNGELTTAQNDDLEAGELMKLQLAPGEGPGEQAKPSDHAGQDSNVELKLDGQEPGTPSSTSRNDHQWDVATNNPNYSHKEGHIDEETLDI